jgi:hypothetical protein
MLLLRLFYLFFCATLFSFTEPTCKPHQYTKISYSFHSFTSKKFDKTLELDCAGSLFSNFRSALLQNPTVALNNAVSLPEPIGNVLDRNFPRQGEGIYASCE